MALYIATDGADFLMPADVEGAGKKDNSEKVPLRWRLWKRAMTSAILKRTEALCPMSLYSPTRAKVRW